MKKLVLSLVAMATILSVANAQCSGKQIVKMIDSGFSKQEIKKICAKSDRNKADILIHNFINFINKGITYNNIWGNSNVSCIEKEGGHSYGISKYRYQEIRKYCDTIAKTNAASAVGLNIKSIKMGQERTIQKLIKLSKTNHKLKSYIKQEIKDYHLKMIGTIDYSKTMAFFFPY